MKKACPCLSHPLPLSCCSLCCPGAFAQEGAGGAGAPVESHTILQTILGGGPLIILIWLAILGTSIVMVTFIIQLFLNSARRTTCAQGLRWNPPSHHSRGQLSGGLGNLPRQQGLCRPRAQGALDATIGRGKDAVETALIEHGLREAPGHSEPRTATSPVVGVVAPDDRPVGHASSE